MKSKMWHSIFLIFFTGFLVCLQLMFESHNNMTVLAAILGHAVCTSDVISLCQWRHQSVSVMSSVCVSDVISLCQWHRQSVSSVYVSDVISLYQWCHQSVSVTSSVCVISLCQWRHQSVSVMSYFCVSDIISLYQWHEQGRNVSWAVFLLSFSVMGWIKYSVFLFISKEQTKAKQNQKLLLYDVDRRTKWSLQVEMLAVCTYSGQLFFFASFLLYPLGRQGNNVA